MERKYMYILEMSVPRGIRRGRLLIEVCGGIVRGQLEMFRNMTEIISGSYERGRIEFDGCMKTLGYTMKYHASGKITKRHIELDFDTDKGRFHAIGPKLKTTSPTTCRLKPRPRSALISWSASL